MNIIPMCPNLTKKLANDSLCVLNNINQENCHQKVTKQTRAKVILMEDFRLFKKTGPPKNRNTIELNKGGTVYRVKRLIKDS